MEGLTGKPSHAPRSGGTGLVDDSFNRNRCRRGSESRERITNMNATLISILVVLGMFLGLLWARADVLVSTNGERFVGSVIEESSSNVVFESESAGRLVLPRTKIRELQRTPSAQPAQVTVAVATNAPASAASWKPPGVGSDGADWVQLKSGEWLRGQLKYIQNKEVEFDSDEMDQETLKLKNVSKVYTAHPVYTQFENRKPIYGTVVISNEVVMVLGDEPVSLNRDLLIGITPSGRRGINDWSGNASLGLSLQSGNTHLTTFTTSAELARRTPNTTLLLDYLSNYSQSEGVENANNQRFNSTYDIRLNKDWFVYPIQFEYYNDPLANIDYRLTEGVGAGYYIFDRTGLEWNVSAGPSYQYIKFSTVELGQNETAGALAGVINSRFKADITRRLTFIQSWQSTFSDKESGQYSQHTVSTLEFEVKRHLNLDVSLIWDYIQNPKVRADGIEPQKSDLYLTVGLGVRF